MRSRIKLLIILSFAVGVAFITSCSRDAVEDPSPLGPAGFAISLKVSASPNVLFAGFQNRESTTVTAVLKKYDGTPISGRTLYFELRDALTSTRADGIGYFEGLKAVAAKVTDGNGIVTIDYYGPTAAEIDFNSSYYITAHVGWEGDESITEWTPVYLVRDFSDLIFNVTVDPNILWCTNTRPESTIKAYFAVPDGTPIVGRKIFFEITSGPGYFIDGQMKTFKETDSNGYVTMIYKGPTSSELSADEEWVSIKVQPETWWQEFGPYGEPDPDKYWLHVDFQIRLKKGN
jgi:hypothetical protein